MSFKYFLLLAVALFLSSCAGTKTFTVRTSPERATRGAEIIINGEKKGQSPLTLEIPQDKSLAIVAMKPGFESGSATVETKPDFWLALLWTKNDPKAQVIEQDEVTIPMKRIPGSAGYSPAALPAFKMPEQGAVEIPKLRAMPAF